MKICVVTSHMAGAEPRGPRHAVAAKFAFPHAEIVFVDVAPAGRAKIQDPPELSALKIKRHTLEYPTRTSDPIRLAISRAMVILGRICFRVAGTIHESVFGDRIRGLTKKLKGIPADVYIAHNIETLLPAFKAASMHGASVVFDCMEYYSDMGEGQSKTEAIATKRAERRYLPKCALVIASSDCMADALAIEYGISKPLAAYNTPTRSIDFPKRNGVDLSLYWRNTVIGFGQRGLEDALEALTLIPTNVRLFLQGGLPLDGGSSLFKRIEQLGLRDRVTVLAPYAPAQAIVQAAPYDIGLCLERRGPRNHDLTVSNKIFDYHMAGLAVIASNLPGLADVINRSGGGVLCEPGSPPALAQAILGLLSNPAQMLDMQNRGRRFAMEEANLELEIEKIAKAFRHTLESHGVSG